jgi:predicted dehydrogenase
VSIADVYEPAAASAAKRYGYERYDTSWQAVVDADDIHVVSVVVANHLHREIVEALLAAGKHVLCEKPLSDTLENARAMADAAAAADSIARVGFTYRRAPGIAYIRELIHSGVLGEVYHVSGRYWADYASDASTAISWRFKGAPGTGALADVGSHVAYLMEFLGGDIASVAGGRFNTVIRERPKPLGAASGHANTAVSDELDTVENDDYAAFTIDFASGAGGAVEVSRVAAGHPNGLILEVFGQGGSARWEQERPSELQLYVAEGPAQQRGIRQVFLGPGHPYVTGGAAIDVAGVGEGAVVQDGVVQAESHGRGAFSSRW